MTTAAADTLPAHGAAPIGVDRRGGGALRRRWRAMALGAALLALAGLAGCGSAGPGDGAEPVILDNSEDPWMARDGACVRESTEGPLRRVVNRADPELCGRAPRHRPADFVRVLAPPATPGR